MNNLPPPKEGEGGKFKIKYYDNDYLMHYGVWGGLTEMKRKL